MKKNILVLALIGIATLPLIVYGARIPAGTDWIINTAQSFANLVILVCIAIGVIFIALAGLKFLTARGDESKLAEARSMLLWGLIGIAIIVGALLLVNTVRNLLPKPQGGGEWLF